MHRCPIKDALFRFHIFNGEDSTYVEYTHPVPVFLCQPDPSQKISRQFYEAYTDLLTLVNGLHHDECMSKITAPCICGKPAKDALKSPINLLHLAQPMIIMQSVPVCGDKVCGVQVGKQLMEKQNKTMATAREEENKVFMKMDCDVCKSLDAKRCAGCGRVAYCGKECQTKAWKKHKSECGRKMLNTPSSGPELPYGII